MVYLKYFIYLKKYIKESKAEQIRIALEKLKEANIRKVIFEFTNSKMILFLSKFCLFFIRLLLKPTQKMAAQKVINKYSINCFYSLR